MYKFIYNVPIGWAGFAQYTYIYKFKFMGYIKLFLLKHKQPGTSIWDIEKIKELYKNKLKPYEENIKSTICGYPNS